ncbi:hypothetical protein, partial [Dermatophilus congolensis]
GCGVVGVGAGGGCCWGFVSVDFYGSGSMQLSRCERVVFSGFLERIGGAGRRACLFGAGLVVAAVVLLCVVIPFFVWTRLGQRVDERSRWSALLPPEVNERFDAVLTLVSVPAVAVGLLVVVGIALLRRRWDLAVFAVVLVGLANVTTQVGKVVIPRRDVGIGAENTLPSGHMTVITGLALALLVVVPRLVRVPLMMLSAFACTLAGAVIVVMRWHRPSDVVAAVGVLALWSGVAVLVAVWLRSRGRDVGLEGSVSVRGVVAYGVVALAGSVAAGVVLIALGLVAHEEPSNVVVAAVTFGAIGVATCVLMVLSVVAVDELDCVSVGSSTAGGELGD